jgi:Sodium/hydrogen exchanger family
VGLAIGAVFGLFAIVFNKIPNAKIRMWSKFFYCALMAVAVVIADTFSGWHNSKFVGTLSFGYVCKLVWKDEKPVAYLATYWYTIQVFLFSCTGGGVDFSKVNSEACGYAILIVFIGVIIRATVAFLVTADKDLTIKERIFIGCTWMAKGTV